MGDETELKIFEQVISGRRKLVKPYRNRQNPPFYGLFQPYSIKLRGRESLAAIANAELMEVKIK